MIIDFFIIGFLLVLITLLSIFIPWIMFVLIFLIFLVTILQNLTQIIASYIKFPQLKSLKPISEKFISIHVPAFNEPPYLLKNTLKKLSQLKYEKYEVIIVDNNTVDRSVWEPVEKYCKKLGKNFKFFHVEKLEGFKAGALNFAQNVIDSRTEFIAVLDADYEVDPEFLKESLKYFTDEEIAFVQFPQAYKNVTARSKGIRIEYEYFFKSYLKMANRFGCVTSTGTMVVLRAPVLKKIGLYDKTCLTEDAEIGVRLTQAGYRGIYVEKIMGRGLMPYDIEAYKKQKTRWSYGNAQVLKKGLLEILFSKKIDLLQKIGLLSQMTAWFNFTLIPILFVFVGSIFKSVGVWDQQILNWTLSISIMTIYSNIILRFVSFYVTFIKKYNPGEILRAFFVYLGMVNVYSTTFLRSFLNINLFFERTNKFILPKMPNILKNTFIESLIGICGLLLSLIYLINNQWLMGLTTLLISLNYLLIFYVWWEILPIKYYSASLIQEMQDSFEGKVISEPIHSDLSLLLDTT